MTMHARASETRLLPIAVRCWRRLCRLATALMDLGETVSALEAVQKGLSKDSSKRFRPHNAGVYPAFVSFHYLLCCTLFDGGAGSTVRVLSPTLRPPWGKAPSGWTRQTSVRTPALCCWQDVRRAFGAAYTPKLLSVFTWRARWRANRRQSIVGGLLDWEEGG